MARVRCSGDAAREISGLGLHYRLHPLIEQDDHLGLRPPGRTAPPERCDAAVFLVALALNSQGWASPAEHRPASTPTTHTQPATLTPTPTLAPTLSLIVTPTPTRPRCSTSPVAGPIGLEMHAGEAMSVLRRSLGSPRRFASPCEACASYTCCGAWCGGCGGSEEQEEWEEEARRAHRRAALERAAAAESEAEEVAAAMAAAEAAAAAATAAEAVAAAMTAAGSEAEAVAAAVAEAVMAEAAVAAAESEAEAVAAAEAALEAAGAMILSVVGEG